MCTARGQASEGQRSFTPASHHGHLFHHCPAPWGQPLPVLFADSFPLYDQVTYLRCATWGHPLFTLRLELRPLTAAQAHCIHASCVHPLRVAGSPFGLDPQPGYVNAGPSRAGQRLRLSRRGGRGNAPLRPGAAGASLTEGPSCCPSGPSATVTAKATFLPPDDPAQAHPCTTRNASRGLRWQNCPPSSPLSRLHPGPSCTWSESAPASLSPALATHSISAQSVSRTSDSTSVFFSLNPSIIVSPAYPLFSFLFLFF